MLIIYLWFTSSNANVAPNRSITKGFMRLLTSQPPIASTSTTSSSAHLSSTSSHVSLHTSPPRAPTAKQLSSTSGLSASSSRGDSSVIPQRRPGSTEHTSVGADADVRNAPQNPIRYTFSSTGRRSMILVPIAVRNAPPLYHISWRDDFWILDSIITTVRRGGSEDGRLVGEFGCAVTLFLKETKC